MYSGGAFWFPLGFPPDGHGIVVLCAGIGDLGHWGLRLRGRSAMVRDDHARMLGDIADDGLAAILMGAGLDPVACATGEPKGKDGM